jgi:hypothetical protein
MKRKCQGENQSATLSILTKKILRQILIEELSPNSTVCFTDLDQVSERIIFELILTTFIASLILGQ